MAGTQGQGQRRVESTSMVELCSLWSTFSGSSSPKRNPDGTQFAPNFPILPLLTKWMHGGQGAGHGEAEVWLACFLIPSALLEQWLQPPIHILQAP